MQNDTTGLLEYDMRFAMLIVWIPLADSIQSWFLPMDILERYILILILQNVFKFFQKWLTFCKKSPYLRIFQAKNI